MTQAEHLTDEQVSTLVDAELPLPEAAALRGHMAACAECTDRYESTASRVALLRDLPEVEVPRDFTIGPRSLGGESPARSRLRRLYLASRVFASSAAAGCLLLLGADVYLTRTAQPMAMMAESSTQTAPLPAANSAPAATAPPSAAAQPASAAKPAAAPRAAASPAADPAGAAAVAPAPQSAPPAAPAPSQAVDAPLVAPVDDPADTGSEGVQRAAGTAAPLRPTPAPQEAGAKPAAAAGLQSQTPGSAVPNLRPAEMLLATLAVAGIAASLLVRRRLRAGEQS